MAEFEHLFFEPIYTGKHKNKGGGKMAEEEKTNEHLANRNAHAAQLRNSIKTLSKEYFELKEKRKEENLPPLPDAFPVFLEVDKLNFKSEQVKTQFGIDFVGEFEKGFIIGSSADNQFNKLHRAIDKFLKDNKRYTRATARLFTLFGKSSDKLKYILSEQLLQRWDTLIPDSTIEAEVSVVIPFYIPNPPQKQKDESDDSHNRRMEKWRDKKQSLEVKRDELALELQTKFSNFVSGYNGEILATFAEFNDSFSTKISISVAVLKDLALNFPYILEIEETTISNLLDTSADVGIESIRPQIQAPNSDSAKVCIIDSGIQEQHFFISPAINSKHSISHVQGSPVADYVHPHGHGTCVAGVVLYGETIPQTGVIQLECILQNARVLDDNCKLPRYLYPPSLMEKVIKHFHGNYGTRIFNLSINSNYPHKKQLMSTWAFQIDKLCYELDIIVVISAGNIDGSVSSNNLPSIKDYLNSEEPYPSYLSNATCRIANPGQSLLGVTVGSVGVAHLDNTNEKSFGGRGDVSSFSRVGPGLWHSIKPDFVGFGGEWVITKTAPIRLIQRAITSTELVNSTLHGSKAISRNGLGTSFAAPFVTKVIAQIQNRLPNQTALVYKVLLANGSYWNVTPNNNYRDISLITNYGYGLPDSSKVIENNEFRITYVGSHSIAPGEVHLYRILIPENVRRQGDQYETLISIALAFKAQPKRNGNSFKSYFSSSASWKTNKPSESFEHFKRRMSSIEEQDLEEESTSSGLNHDWFVKEGSNHGIEGFKRRTNTLQKDCFTCNSYNLPEELCIAVIGHKGWEKDSAKKADYAIAVTIEDLGLQQPIYESIMIENQIQLTTEIRI